MNKYLRFLKLKLEGKTILTTNFINTKPKFKTIQPDVRLSYNENINHIKHNGDVETTSRIDSNRGCKQSSLEVCRFQDPYKDRKAEGF